MIKVSLEHLINLILPYIIHFLELIGIIIVVISALKGFYQYIKSLFNPSTNLIKVDFAEALALALEFKLAGEILKTVLIRTLDEMYILAAIILLRAILTFVIHWEIKFDKTHHAEQ